MKICNRCKQSKPLEDFYKKRHYERKVGAEYHFAKCKECCGVENKQYIQANKLRYKEIQRRSHLKNTFGISLEQYQSLLEKQNGCCALCLKPAQHFKTALAVDHRHAGPNAGEITGLLCWPCNQLLIGKHHDPEVFDRAAAYLRQGTGWFVPPDKVKTRRKRRKLRANVR